MLVMCEVYNPDGSPHETNTRAKLRDILTPKILEQEPLYGFEQEYTMCAVPTTPPPPLAFRVL